MTLFRFVLSMNCLALQLSTRYDDVVGFVGISNSPSCGLSVGVKDRGSTMKAPMHQSLDCPTTEISSMKSKQNQDVFLRRVRKYEARRSGTE